MAGNPEAFPAFLGKGESCMIKKFCNRCGKTYDANGKCECRAARAARAARAKRYDSGRRVERAGGFYHSPMWRNLSRRIMSRDGAIDRLQFFVCFMVKRNLIDSYFPERLPRIQSNVLAVRKIISDIAAVLVDVYGNPKRISSSLTVHHIIPRNDNDLEQWNPDNLITVSNDTHNLIHRFYNRDDCFKAAMQSVLYDSMKCR